MNSGFAGLSAATLLIVSFVFFCSAGHSQENGLAELREAYEAAAKRVLDPIAEKYEAALVRLKGRLTQGGRLQEALVVDNEIRIQKGEEPRDAQQVEVPELDRLRIVNSEAKAAAGKDLNGKYLGGLEKLQARFQREGKLDAALEVEEEKKRIGEKFVTKPVPNVPAEISAKVKEKGGSHYLLVKKKVPHAEAEKVAGQLGGHLVHIRNRTENSWLYETFGESMKETKSNVWIGATDSAEEGEWVWGDGSKVKFTNWGSGAPNNAGDEDAALMVATDSTWNDAASTKKWWFVVEWDDWPPTIPADLLSQLEGYL